jgi:hypothetical protein
MRMDRVAYRDAAAAARPTAWVVTPATRTLAQPGTIRPLDRKSPHGGRHCADLDGTAWRIAGKGICDSCGPGADPTTMG